MPECLTNGASNSDKLGRVRGVRGALVHGLGFACAFACGSAQYFVCNGNDDCTFEEDAGVCQPTGACSFPDDTCDTGQRYADESPPSLAGECVQHDSDTETSTTGEPDPSTTGGASSSGDDDDDDDDDADDDTGTPGDTTEDACPPDWWDCDWGARQRLSMARSSGELESFPVLVLLGPGRVDFASMQQDGEDLRFVSADGTDLPYQFETFDPEGLSFVWVTVDRLGSDADHVWLYYDNPVAESPDREPEVWADGYAGVWHLHDEPLDSTDLANHGDPNGNTGPVPGQLAEGHQLLGSSARIDVEPSESLANVFHGGGTVSAWIRPSGWGGNGFGRIVHKDDGPGWLFYIVEGGGLRFSYGFGGGQNYTWATLMGIVPLHTWSHVAVTYDPLGADVPRIFVDGVEQELDEPPESPMAMPVSDGDIPLTIGNRPDNTRRFDRVLDEIRLSNVSRSPEWIAVQYASTNDALFEFGDIERWGALR